MLVLNAGLKPKLYLIWLYVKSSRKSMPTNDIEANKMILWFEIWISFDIVGTKAQLAFKIQQFISNLNLLI